MLDFEVIYSAAHAEFPDTEPLGGGKAVADYLIREWSREPETTGFALTVLSPHSLGLMGRSNGIESPNHRRISQNGRDAARPSRGLPELTEWEYARFCRAFERVATAEILKRDPNRCVVLSNDISEGPDFAELGARGYRIVTIFHVDVVEYFTKFYLHGVIRPETAARFRWFGLLPGVLRLVFEKQRDCVWHSARLVVPSDPMGTMIRRCYPWCDPEKIVVVPWGDVAEVGSAECGVRKAECGVGKIGEDEFVIVTLSRLSPEKGIERLLRALARLELEGETPVEPLPSRRGIDSMGSHSTDDQGRFSTSSEFLTNGSNGVSPTSGNRQKLRVFICGAAAYMRGKAYEQKLRKLASKLPAERVEFLGHVTGARKAALLRRADLFVSPSIHESFGLAIAEAQAAGCRVISHGHYGAAGTVVDCADPAALARAIGQCAAAGRIQKQPVATAKGSDAAGRLAEILREVNGPGRPGLSEAEAR